jgi:hypothetical protein
MEHWAQRELGLCYTLMFTKLFSHLCKCLCTAINHSKVFIQEEHVFVLIVNGTSCLLRKLKYIIAEHRIFELV